LAADAKAAGIIDTAMMQTLIDHGAAVNSISSNGRTPLHLAAAEGKVETVQLLLCRGALINRETTTGATALTAALSQRHSAVVQLLLNKGAAVSADTLRQTARQSDSEGVQLVVAALGPAADATVLSDACRSAAAVGRVQTLAVLLKQLGLVDRAAVKLVVRGLRQPEVAAAACIAEWVAETKSITEQQQRLDQQQRQVAAERLAVQQLVVATAGMQRQVATERQALRQPVDVEASVPEARRRGSWARARKWQWHAMTKAAGLLLLVLLK
jgi:hypothetical protein